MNNHQVCNYYKRNRSFVDDNTFAIIFASIEMKNTHLKSLSYVTANILALYNLRQSMHHVHDIEPASIENDGERPAHGHQVSEAATDKTTCDVLDFMFNDTCVSIQQTKCMKKLGTQ